jgi:phenylpyruvate tautomerase PptA (4-oxalocrotonate tautomerase family)
MIRRCSPPSSGAGAGWIIVSQIAVMLALAGVAFGDPAHWIAWTVVFSLVLGFAGATPQQMPTYSVTTANIALSQDQKSGIASAITAAHSAHTGAPSYFAQFFFNEVSSGSHFIGGKPNKSPHVCPSLV